MMDKRSNLIIEVQRCSDGVINGSDITYSVLRRLVNNSLLGGSGGGTHQGGSQADTLTGISGDDSHSSCQGHDTLQSASGDDVFNGDARRYLLKSGGGNNSLFRGKDKDT